MKKINFYQFSSSKFHKIGKPVLCTKIYNKFCWWHQKVPRRRPSVSWIHDNHFWASVAFMFWPLVKLPGTAWSYKRKSCTIIFILNETYIYVFPGERLTWDLYITVQQHSNKQVAFSWKKLSKNHPIYWRFLTQIATERIWLYNAVIL